MAHNGDSTSNDMNKHLVDALVRATSQSNNNPNQMGMANQGYGGAMGGCCLPGYPSSDDAQLLFSGAAKLKEFERLHYPAGIRRFACTILARDTCNSTWLKLRKRQ